MRPVPFVFLCLAFLLFTGGCRQEEQKAVAKAPGPKVEIVDPFNPKPQPNQPPPPANPGPGQVGSKPAQEKAKSLLGNIRARAVRTERQNELKQISTFFGAMPSPPRTVEQFTNEIKREAPAIAKAIEEGYYGINLKARPFSQDVLAYETDGDTGNLFYYVRASGSVDTIQGDQLKAELGQK